MIDSGGDVRNLEVAHRQWIAATVAAEQAALVRFEAIVALRGAGWTWAAIGRRIGLEPTEVIELFASDG